MTRPDYSVVIPIDRPEKTLRSVDALLKLPAHERPRDIFVCVGKNPSLQRNLGLELCKSPLVYFLDEDSSVIPGTASRLAVQFEGERTAAAGGPNLPYPDATNFEQTASAVLASWLGSFKVRNRYASIGSVKEATEKDLILCNMMVRREIFREVRGFRPNLYPNEENEFLNRLLHSGYQLIYDPAAAVYRPRRKNIRDFCWQAFRYGRGRARQIKVYPCLSDLVHMVPFGFVLYILSLFLPLFFPPTAYAWAGWIDGTLWRLPLYLFLVLAVGTGVSVVSWFRRPLDILGVPLLIFCRQFSYGIGLFTGLVTSLPKPSTEPVKIFKVIPRGGRYRLAPVAPRKQGKPSR
jgi:succinoglycan biosynthesis protein ExoA